MTTIQYEGLNLSIPDAWEDVTLGHYEGFCNDKPAEVKDKIYLIAKVCKTSPDILLKWPAEIFNRIVQLTSFLFKDPNLKPSPVVEVNGINYVIAIEEKLSLGEWLDAEEVQKSSDNLLSRILSIVCRPTGEEYDADKNEQRAEIFRSLTMDKILPLLAFFLSCKNALDLRSKTYTSLIQVIAHTQEHIRNSQKRGELIKSLPIWRRIRFYVLMKSVEFRLRRLSLSCCTKKTEVMQSEHSANLNRN